MSIHIFKGLSDEHHSIRAYQPYIANTILGIRGWVSILWLKLLIKHVKYENIKLYVL